MGASKKYIGESLLKGEPKKTLGFKIKDGTITTDKLADGSVTNVKLSDDLQTLISNLEDTYNSIGDPDSIARLDENNYLAESQLPREKTDDVLEFDGFGAFSAVINMSINDGGVYFSKLLNVFAATNTKIPTEFTSFVNDWPEAEWFGTRKAPSSGITPFEGKIYIDKSTNIPYRWDGTALVAITSPVSIESIENETILSLK